jgi:hypothetical protein
MDEVLVLSVSKNIYYYSHINIDGLTIAGLFRDVSGICAIILKIMVKYKLPFTSIFYGDW